MGDMTMTEIAALLWRHRTKVIALFAVVWLGPILYEEWSKKRAAEQLELDRQSVYSDASVAGSLLAGALHQCVLIGLDDLQRCADYKGQLLQEQAPPVLARTAIEHRDRYLQNCWRFYDRDGCVQLLMRSYHLSSAQSGR